MKTKHFISRDIELFYNRASEETRLEKGMGVFEFERIKSLILHYISKPHSTIVDVGGGTGKYSAWLAQNNHKVHMIEPVAKHVEIARQRSNSLKNKFSIQIGDSRQLNVPSNSADIVILHGPLYHLQKLNDRIASIQEAKRVLKNGGIMLGFAINHTASTLVGLLNGLIHKKSFFEMCREELTTGMHNPPDDFPWLLAEAYYHKPEELKNEFVSQELTFLNIHAVEGMAWLDKNFFVSLQNEYKKQRLLKLLEITENDSYLLPFSPHMMIAAQKKQNL